MNEAILMENRTYWTHRAPSYSEVNREELATRRHAAWKQVLYEQIRARFPGRIPDQIHILEIGTGPGFFAILLAEMGYRVTAIDLTPSMLDEARRNAGKLCDCISFIEMNAEKLSFDDACFDVILSRNVTWNLPEPEKAYTEWVRVLKPGGLLLTFDANWYAYLCDELARIAWLKDREISSKEALEDYNVGDNFDHMEEIARRLPLTHRKRPAWDIETLMNLGMSAQADPGIWERVWSRQESVNFSSTPLFMVCGYKAALPL